MHTAYCHRYETSKATVSNAKILAEISDLGLKQARDLLVSLEQHCFINLSIAAEPIEAVKKLHDIGFGYAYIDSVDEHSIHRHGFSDDGYEHRIFRHPHHYTDSEIREILSADTMDKYQEWTTDGKVIINIVNKDLLLIEDDYAAQAVINHLQIHSPIQFYSIESSESILWQAIADEFNSDKDEDVIQFPDLSVLHVRDKQDKTRFEYDATFFDGPEYIRKIFQFITTNGSQVIASESGRILHTINDLSLDYQSHPAFRRYETRMLKSDK